MDTAFDGAVYDAVQRARRRIRDAGRQQNGRRHRGALEAVVEPHLKELARTFERFYRQAGRRTAHLETRRREGGRPTHMALDDLRRARPGALYRDEKNGTYIVLGPRGRTHVFNPDGKHITSVQLHARCRGAKAEAPALARAVPGRDRLVPRILRFGRYAASLRIVRFCEDAKA